MTQAERIIRRFGNMSRLARALEPPRAVSTVQRWKLSGFIPARHHQAIMAAARKEGVVVAAEDFIAHLQDAAA